MLRNNPGHVKDSINEASRNRGGNPVEAEIPPRLEKMGIFWKPRCASLEDTPKKLTKGEKRVALSPHEDRIPKKGKSSTSPTYAAANRGQTPQKDGEWQLVDKKKDY